MNFFDRFKELEGAGILDASSNTDLFCLHATFIPEIQELQARHYRGVAFEKKKKSTKDPAYPAGTSRRRRLYEIRPSLATELTNIGSRTGQPRCARGPGRSTPFGLRRDAPSGSGTSRGAATSRLRRSTASFVCARATWRHWASDVTCAVCCARVLGDVTRYVFWLRFLARGPGKSA